MMPEDGCVKATCSSALFEFHLSPHFPLRSAAPVSREAVTVSVAASCVRGRGKAAVCAPPPGHHHYCGHHYLGGVQPGKTTLACRVLREGHYICSAISSCASQLPCQTSKYGVRWSVKSFFIPLQCFVQTRVTDCSSAIADPPYTNDSREKGLERELFYLPVRDGFVNSR